MVFIEFLGFLSLTDSTQHTWLTLGRCEDSKAQLTITHLSNSLLPSLKQGTWSPRPATGNELTRVSETHVPGCPEALGLFREVLERDGQGINVSVPP
jgi:hypothetical protein